MTTVILDVTDKDFNGIVSTSMMWGEQWSDHIEDGRFIAIDYIGTLNISTDFKFAYWVDDYVQLMICRGYIKANGFEFIAAYDNATEDYIIVTDYAGDFWKVNA